ncbi:hypothetical protein F1B92_05490, partial [Campylobacter sp. FMV-PI01]
MKQKYLKYRLKFLSLALVAAFGCSSTLLASTTHSYAYTDKEESTENQLKKRVELLEKQVENNLNIFKKEVDRYSKNAYIFQKTIREVKEKYLEKKIQNFKKYEDESIKYNQERLEADKNFTKYKDKFNLIKNNGFNNNQQEKELSTLSSEINNQSQNLKKKYIFEMEHNLKSLDSDIFNTYNSDDNSSIKNSIKDIRANIEDFHKNSNETNKQIEDIQKNIVNIQEEYNKLLNLPPQNKKDDIFKDQEQNDTPQAGKKDEEGKGGGLNSAPNTKQEQEENLLKSQQETKTLQNQKNAVETNIAAVGVINSSSDLISQSGIKNA